MKKMNESKLNFSALAKVMDKIDDNGERGRCGNWEMALGGYDHGYEIYYRGAPIGRVNYELKEYELYDEDFMSKDQIPEFLAAIDARKFKDVGYHEEEDHVIDDDGPRYVQESIGNLETFLAEKEKEFKPSGVNPSWDESEDKVWAVQDYLSSMGSFTDEDREYLRQTAPELLSLEEEEDIVNESMLPLKDITKRYSAKQRTALDGKSWWVGFDNETGKYIPGNRYKTKGECETGIIVDMEYGRLDATPDELEKIESLFAGLKESTRKTNMKKVVKETSELQKFKRAIEAAKKRVIRDVKHHGVSEKQGDLELRELRDRLFDIEHDWKNKTCSRDEELLIGKLLDDFENWVSTYNGRMEESTNWEELEKGMKWNLEIRSRKELDELYGLIHLASLKFDDAQKWVDKLEEFYDSSDKNWELEINGKKDLDTLYSLVRAGATSMTDDKVAIKWRNRLGKFYAEFNKLNESTRKNTMKKIVKEGTADVKNIINDYGDACVQYGKSGDRIDKIWMQRQLDKVYQALDCYGESNKKVVKEADGDVDLGEPKIYVGTYAKYNNGSIDGKWITLSDYNTYEEFVDACRELHSDEKDPEFMVQDYENFPEKWYHEGGLPTEEEFDKINEYYMMDDSEKDAYAAYVSYTDNDSIDDFHDAYQGQFNSAEDFAYHIVDSMGWDSLGQENLDMYFDYDSFGRDLMYDFHIGDPDNTDSEGEPEDPDHYYDNDGYDQGEYESDRQVAEDYVDSLGGVDQLGPDTARNYFDYESFGRDLFINDYFEEDGYVFSRY
jgi:antirestriction protein